jgi:hypothetical protein
VPRGRPPSRARWLIPIAALSLLAAGAYVFKVSGKMPDFDVYLTAGHRALAGEPLYRAGDGHYQFKYLPAFAFVAAPFALLDPPAARALWFAGSVLLLPALFALSLGLVGQRHKPATWLVLLTIVVLGKFYARELVLGQVNLLFAVVASGAVLLLTRGRETAGGLLVALAIVLKPYGMVLLPWVVARRQWSSVAAVLFGLAAAVALPSLRYGVAGGAELHRAWWATVVTTTSPNLTNPDNVSWLAMYARWFGEGALASGLAAATAIVMGLAAVQVWRRRASVARPEPLEGSLALVFIPFVSPQGWDYVLLVATPAVMMLIDREAGLPRVLRWVTVAALLLVGLSIYDVMGRSAYHAFLEMSGITLCFAVAMGALVTLRERRLA